MLTDPSCSYEHAYYHYQFSRLGDAGSRVRASRCTGPVGVGPERTVAKVSH